MTTCRVLAWTGDWVPRSLTLLAATRPSSQYYFPNAPKWDGDAWSFEGTSYVAPRGRSRPEDGR